jgi:DNA-binding MarR family transcriptional regulator
LWGFSTAQGKPHEQTRKPSVAPMQRWCCTTEQVVSRRCYTVSSYKYLIMSIYNNRDSTLPNQNDIKQTEVETNLTRRSRVRRTERFLKGPIALPEIAAASRLPGKALAVLLAIHHQSDLTGKPSVTLPARLLADLGISRGAKSRGLQLLEKAGLVTLARSRGRAAKVQLKNHNRGGIQWAAS